jgi:hypothetical protein
LDPRHYAGGKICCVNPFSTICDRHRVASTCRRRCVLTDFMNEATLVNTAKRRALNTERNWCTHYIVYGQAGLNRTPRPTYRGVTRAGVGNERYLLGPNKGGKPRAYRESHFQVCSGHRPKQPLCVQSSSNPNLWTRKYPPFSTRTLPPLNSPPLATCS